MATITPDVFARHRNPVLDDVPAYVPGPTAASIAERLGVDVGDVVKLSSNEAPLGPAPAVRAAVRLAADGDDLHRYPAPDPRELRAAVARYAGVSADQVLLSDGSSETWPLIVRAFSGVGDGVLTVEPSLRSYQQVARLSERVPQVVEHHPPFEVTAELVLAGVDERTRVIFLSTPNNTTSRLVPNRVIAEIAAGAPHAVVVADEHYIEAAPDFERLTAVRLLDEIPNLLVTRTFSKMHGLAGLRVGYAIGPAHAIASLRALRSAWAVSFVAAEGARAALEDHDHLRANIAATAEGRRQLMRGLSDLGAGVIPDPHGGFLLFHLPGHDGQSLARRLLDQGVVTRGDLFPGYVRVSVGTDLQNGRFLEAVREIRGER